MKSLLFQFIFQIIFPFFLIIQAQILNIEQFQNKINDSIPNYNEFGFNADIKHIENTLVTLSARSFNFIQTNKNRFLLINSARIILLDKETILSNGYTHLRSTFNRRNRMNPELFIQYQFDAVRGLNRRDVHGIDFRIRLLSGSKFTLDVALGFMHEYEWWKLKTHNEKNRFIKSTNSVLAAFPLNPNFVFHTTAYYQFSPTRLKNPRIIADSRLTWKISSTVQLAVSNNFFYDSKPIIPIDKIVNETGIELVFRFRS